MTEQAGAAESKRALREHQRELRARLAPAAGLALVPHLEPLWRSGLVVSGFWPIEDEIDLRPALAAAASAGCEVVLPVTPRRGNPLRFRRMGEPAGLVPGPFGTRQPPESEPERTPDLMLVPLLAFDRAGGRLGYGGGFYDRTLVLLRGGQPGVRAVGCAYAAQEVEAVPMEPFDQRLDAVVTEVGLFWVQKDLAGR